MAEFDVVVVGSFMVDMVARVPQWPRPGESVFASEFGIYQGGKGCNQAIGAARAGARVAIVGRLGADAFGDRFIASLREEGITDGGIVRDPDEGTGIALPILDPSGQNMIVVAPRANMRLTAADVGAAALVLRSAGALLLQLEVPVEASAAAAQIAHEAGATVIWNAAPATRLREAALALCDVLIVNEGEAAALSGEATDTTSGCLRAAVRLRGQSATTVIVTLGPAGALVQDAAGARMLAGHRLRVIDTTGAGDAFCGAFAAAVTAGAEVDRAIEAGNAAGALAVGVMGAAPSLPNRVQIASLLGGAAQHWSHLKPHIRQ